MPDIKGTMFFTQDNEFGQPCGWSESFIAITAATLDVALPLLDALAGKRANLCGLGVTMNYLRVSNLGVRGDSLIQTPTVEVCGLRQNKPADLPGAGVLLRLQGQDNLFLSRRSYFIKGNPDIAQEIIAPITANGRWNAAWEVYQAELKSGRWGFMVLDRSGANPEKDVTAVTNATPAVITCAGHGFTVGKLVRVIGMTFEPVPNSSATVVVSGIFQVATTPSGDTLTLLGFQPTTPYAGGGTIRRYEKVAKVITSAEIRRYGVHRVGRPFDPARGRFARRAPRRR